MKSIRFATVSFWLASALLPSCATEPVPEGTDGSTHWLKGCGTDNDCQAGLSCLCGACTLDCASDDSCASASDGVAPSCLPLACGGAKSAACQASSTSRSQDQGLSATIALGSACVPPDEYAADFAGFDVGEVSVASSSQCGNDVCLVNHFQGRVTCPNGQATDGASDCLGADESQAVGVSVKPQLLERPPSEAVYCSCRCHGPDAEADYCACESGFECTQLIEARVAGAEDVVGSYCVKQGTTADVLGLRGATSCSADTASCELANDYAAAAVDAPGSDSRTWTSSLDQLITPAAEGAEPRCLPETLPLQTQGGAIVGAACKVFEAFDGGNDENCETKARRPVSPEERDAIRSALAEAGNCAGAPDCLQTRICEITQLRGTDADDQYRSCLEDVTANSDGWCYLDPAQGVGSAELTSACTSEPHARIRFAGSGVPPKGSLTLLACVGDR